MGCDTICDLPDSLLTQILLYLPTKDSVRTSVLSTRWRNLWLSVPGLDLATRHFGCREVFERFMDRFMEFNHGSHLQNFKVVQYYDFDRVNELIGTVVDLGIQHLDVYMFPCKRDVFMHQNIYKSKTLVSLKLDNVELKNPEFVVSLPCLKIMKLFNICYSKDGPLIVEKLISGCPVLEDLQLIRPFNILNENVLLFLRVRSQTLKRCCLEFAINSACTDFTVEFDAPRLEYLSLSLRQSDEIVVKNLSSLLMIDIDNKFNLRYNSPLQPEDSGKLGIFSHFSDFLTGISSVKHMIIYRSTLEVLYCYSKLGPIPKFNNLYHLQAQFSSSLLQLLPVFLESCPNLKNLTLLVLYCYSKVVLIPQFRNLYTLQAKFDCSSLHLLPAFLESCPNLKFFSLVKFCDSEEPRQIYFTNVPRCLKSTLEYVEIKKRMIKDETCIIKLVNYFLENSAVLKKLTLSLIQYPSITNQEAENYNKLLTSTKLSPTCQVIIH